MNIGASCMLLVKKQEKLTRIRFFALELKEWAIFKTMYHNNIYLTEKKI